MPLSYHFGGFSQVGILYNMHTVILKILLNSIVSVVLKYILFCHIENIVKFNCLCCLKIHIIIHNT